MTPEEAHVRRFRQAQAYRAIYTVNDSVAVSSERRDLWQFAVDHLHRDIKLAFLEFGVSVGTSMRFFVESFNNPDSLFFGFDSFEGLPESWDVEFKEISKGAFSTQGSPPKINDDRVTFTKGLYQNVLPDSLPRLENYSVVFVHLDVDLYSSNLFLLTCLWHNIREYYFIMDDFMQDDIIALHDFSRAFPIELHWIAHRAGPNNAPLSAFGHMKRVALEIR